MLEIVLTNENISNTSRKLSNIDSEGDKGRQTWFCLG